VGDQIAYRRRVQRERTRSLLGETAAAPAGFAAMLELVAGIALTYQLEELAAEDEADLCDAGPYGSRYYDEMQSRLKGIVDGLPERERQIVHYHYFHQINFEEIAVLLNISKSRVSRLHKRALEYLQQSLQTARLSELY
jgi:RNA polymerase sigma factor for flagellar operon FliA